MSSSTEPTLSSSSSADWIRPDGGPDGEPRWGLPGALQVGLPPTPGPRGLLRIFTPYLDHPHERLINFVAIEPIPDGASARGFSELEPSTLDPGQPGKRLWSADSLEGAAAPGDSSAPAPGVIEEVDGTSRLTLWVGFERFDNGAEVAVRVRLRADRPHEVELAGFAREKSVPLAHLVLTATMGNWARLRELHLAGRVVHPRELWPGFTRTDFTEHARFPLSLLARDGDAVVVTATGDEGDPLSVTYADDTHAHWRFEGRRAAQGWRVDDPHPALVAQVNGRWAYWASTSPIPGGVTYENVEIVEPFRQGAALRFFVDPLDDTAVS